MSGRTAVAVFLQRQARRQRLALWLAAASAVATAGGATLLLGVSGWFLAGAALAGAAGPLAIQAFNYLLPSAGLRLFAIARTAGRYGERLYGHQAALRALAALRPALFAGLAAAPPQRSLAIAAGEASSRLVQDVDALETAFVRRSAPWAALSGAGAAALCIMLASPWAAGVFAGGLAAQLAAGRILAGRWTKAPASELLHATGKLKSGLSVYVAAAAELRAFGLVPAAVDALLAHDVAMGAASLRRSYAEASLGLFESLAPALTLAAIAALGRHAPLPMAALAILAGLAGFEACGGLLRAAEETSAYRAAISRLDIMAGEGGEAAAASRDASLVIDGKHLQPGARVAICGPSGCGKTRTLLALLGLRPAPAGRFQVGGENLESMPIGWARGLFAYAPQDAQALTGTIAENLRLAAKDADDATLWDALNTAQLDARVRRMSAGLETWIGEGGEMLSGGERRRLAVARALLRPAPWLVLDEPTEGLDGPTEAALIEALGVHVARTRQGLLLVSHRPAPLQLCSRRFDISGAA